MKAVNFSVIEKFFTNDIGPAAMAKIIDFATRDYSGYVLKDTDLCGAPWVAEHVYALYQLRNALLKAEGIEVLED
jgi:hypothetical protein